MTHIVDSPRGPFEDLIWTAKGVDIVPEHNMLSDLSDHLAREQSKAEDLGDAYNIYAQLRRVLREGGVGDHYDVLICDPPATESDHLYNAIYATPTLVLPLEPSWKGQASVEGLADLATNFADQLNIDVGVPDTIPNGVKNTSDQRVILEEIQHPTPEVIGDRTFLIENCWKQQCSACRYVQEHRDCRRDYEIETLAQFDRIARFLEAEVGLEVSDAPVLGALEKPACGDSTAVRVTTIRWAAARAAPIRQVRLTGRKRNRRCPPQASQTQALPRRDTPAQHRNCRGSSTGRV